MVRVEWSKDADRELEELVSDSAVRQQIRQNAEETLHFVRSPAEHEGAMGGIMWHRCTTHAQERRNQEEWGSESWEEDNDTPKAQVSNYYLLYRPMNAGRFEVLGVRDVRQIASMWQRMSGGPPGPVWSFPS
jgi:hypothetical protein